MVGRCYSFPRTAPHKVFYFSYLLQFVSDYKFKLIHEPCSYILYCETSRRQISSCSDFWFNVILNCSLSSLSFSLSLTYCGKLNPQLVTLLTHGTVQNLLSQGLSCSRKLTDGDLNYLMLNKHLLT